MRKPPHSVISLVRDVSVIKYSRELRDRHFSLTFTITTESQIKTEDKNKDCISYLQVSYMHLYSFIESAIKSIKIFKL